MSIPVFLGAAPWNSKAKKRCSYPPSFAGSQYKFVETPVTASGATPADLVPAERPDAIAGKGFFISAEFLEPPSLLRARMAVVARRRGDESEELTRVPERFALKWALINGASGDGRDACHLF